MKNRLLKVLCVLSFSILCLIMVLKTLDIIHFKCIFKHLFGIYCTGCGTTRMVKTIIDLEFYRAFRYNPLLFILLPFFVPYAFYLYIIYVFEREDQITKRIPNQFWNILLFFVTLFGVLRNIPLFSFLAPTIIH